jgi:hypothetical protein
MWILARSNRTCGSHRLVQPFGAWNGLWTVRSGLSVRCWVLREHAFVVLLRTTGSAPSPNQSPGWVARWLRSEWVSGCSLRTTQWMRASLWSSCEEHTVDVLAPGADEGRRRLRKASGSCQPSCDPRVSEWGNPASVMWGHPRLNI